MATEWVKVEAVDQSNIIGLATMIAFLALFGLAYNMSMLGMNTLIGILVLVVVPSIIPVSKTNIARANIHHALNSMIIIGGGIALILIGDYLNWGWYTW